MNILHRWCCRSRPWARAVDRWLVPWALDGVDLGAQVVEIGPGYGATTRALLRRVPQLTAVEIDPELAARLRDLFSGAVTVVHGDGTSMPLQAGSASGVVCFTMLHHVPSPQLQDRLFADAYRVLRPGGVFAGSDSVATPLFRLLHVGDTSSPSIRSRCPRDCARRASPTSASPSRGPRPSASAASSRRTAGRDCWMLERGGCPGKVKVKSPMRGTLRVH